MPLGADAALAYNEVPHMIEVGPQLEEVHLTTEIELVSIKHVSRMVKLELASGKARIKLTLNLHRERCLARWMLNFR